MSIKALLHILDCRGVETTLGEGQLVIRARKGVLTPDLVAGIKGHKAELAAYLTAERALSMLALAEAQGWPGVETELGRLGCSEEDWRVGARVWHPRTVAMALAALRARSFVRSTPIDRARAAAPTGGEA
jgi:hypothetical protein